MVARRIILAVCQLRLSASLQQPDHPARVRQCVRSGRRRFRANHLRPGGNVTGFTQFEYAAANGWSCSRSRSALTSCLSFSIRDYTSRALFQTIVSLPHFYRCGAVSFPPVRISSRRRRDRRGHRRFRLSVTLLAAFIFIPVSLSTFHATLIIDAARASHPTSILPLFATPWPDVSTTPHRSLPPRCQLRRSHPQAHKPADLPVQVPSKYELTINLKPPRRSVSMSTGMLTPPTSDRIDQE